MKHDQGFEVRETTDGLSRIRLIPLLGGILLVAFFMVVFICSCNVQPAKAAEITLKASWYSVESLKREGTWKYSKGVMANGKAFKDEAFTCASRDFPLGTTLRITNARNSKSVCVKCTDRINLRFKGKRIDLSKAAFQAIADLRQGVISVTVERIS